MYDAKVDPSSPGKDNVIPEEEAQDEKAVSAVAAADTDAPGTPKEKAVDHISVPESNEFVAICAEFYDSVRIDEEAAPAEEVDTPKPQNRRCVVRISAAVVGAIAIGAAVGVSGKCIVACAYGSHD